MQDSDSFYIRQRVNSSGRYQVPDPLLSDSGEGDRHDPVWTITLVLRVS